MQTKTIRVAITIDPKDLGTAERLMISTAESKHKFK